MVTAVKASFALRAGARELSSILARVVKVIPKKPPRFCLSTFHLVEVGGQLMVEGGDGIRYLRVKTEVLAPEGLNICVMATLLSDVVSKLAQAQADDILIELGDSMTIASEDGKLRYDTLPYLSGEDYDSLPKADKLLLLLPDGAAKAFKGVAGAASPEDPQPSRQGVHVKLADRALTIAATSGHQLAAQDFKVDTDLSAYLVIHANDAKLIAEIGAAALYSNEGQQSLRFVSAGGEAELYLRPLTAGEVNIRDAVKGIMAKNKDCSVSLNRADVLAVLDSASVVGMINISDHRVQVVRVESDGKGTLRISSGSETDAKSRGKQEGFRGEVACTGPAFVFHSNTEYLVFGFKGANTDTVLLGSIEPLAPVSIVPEPPTGYGHIIMPISVDENA